jgi:hypothetical protein
MFQSLIVMERAVSPKAKLPQTSNLDFGDTAPAVEARRGKIVAIQFMAIA